MKLNIKDVFGLIKPLVDVHTMGVYTMANLLRDCGYKVCVSKDDINEAVEQIHKINNYSLVKRWIVENKITRLGFSYRLDPHEGCDYFMSLYAHLKGDNMFEEDGGQLTQIFFAGLPDTCDMVRGKTNGEVLVFPGNESPIESLSMLKVPEYLMPQALNQNNPYDDMRWNFAKKLIESEMFKMEPPQDHYGYANCGTDSDSYLERLKYAKSKHALPIIRTHSGPYNPNRLEALKEYNSWCHDLAQCQLLDVLSIGSSQLTQSNFGEDWEGKPNGGGVPVNSEI